MKKFRNLWTEGLDICGNHCEFFPEKQRNQWHGSQEQAKKYRQILEGRKKFQQCTPVEIEMTRLANGAGRARVFGWLQGLSFSHLRRKYSLSEETGVWKMLRVQWNDLAKKLTSFLHQIRHKSNNDLKAYLKLIVNAERVEK